MTVRLLRPYAAQAVNTLYTGADEAVLKATSNADDQIELASDYATFKAGQQATRLAPSLSSAGVSALKLKLKRAASRAAANNPIINPVIGSALTFTNSASPGGGTGKTLQVGANMGKFSFRGGNPTVKADGRVVVPVSSNAPSNGGLSGLLPLTPTYNASGFEFGFVNAAPLVEVRAGGNAAHNYRWRVVDLLGEQYVNKTPTLWTGSYSRFDWGGVVRDRAYILETMGSAEVIQVSMTDDTFDCSPLPVVDMTRLIAFTDSFGIGEGTNAQFASFVQEFSRRVGIVDPRAAGIGGTGFFSVGTPTRKKVREQIPDAVAVNADISPSSYDVVLLCQGYNDRNMAAGGPSAALTAEALLTLQTLRATFPNALIVNVAPWPGLYNADQQQLDLEASVRNAFVAFADPLSLYIPVNADPNRWMTGTGRVGATTTSGDTNYLVGDSVGHPTIAGQDRIARRIETAYRSYLAVA